MLRVIASRNAKEYFKQSLSKEDYYSEGQEIRGEWQGIGAEKLGLSGPVNQEGFDALCENRKPGTDERLTQRNKDNRTVGYDFNFHCPKSVSVVYEFTRDERVLDAFKDCVNQTMREIEGEIKTRARKNGADENRTTGNMVWAEFIHFTARPVKGVPDPHLHAHCCAFNTTWDDVEKKWKAAQFRDLKADAPYFEAVFHARFAKQLADLGYRIERTVKGWDLAGVPQRVLDEFSRRTEQVEQKAKELLSVPTLARVAALAEKQNCRIVLSGDTAQHRAVRAGDALRILERHAGLQFAELTEIWRQKADAHKAVIACLRVGDLEHAFKRLDKLGMLRELAPEDRHEALATDYVAAVNEGKSALVISPTHAEGERVTGRIREQLKHAGRLHRDEREFLQLKNLQWTEAQRADARNYQPSLIVQFHQNLAGFRRGERVTVKYADERSVQVERGNGKPAVLPMDQAARFQVHESRTIALASGDMVRITQNGFARGGQRLNNCELKQVAGFTKDGGIKLANGWVIGKDYGNLTHGYCVTSYSSQSKGVDCVFVAESSDSFRAADREQFYVSVSRFKEALTIYTDDKQQLLEAVSKSSERPSATDLVQHNFRTLRPIRQTRTLRPTRLSPVQRLAQTMEQARRWASEILKTGDKNQTSARTVEPSPKIAIPISENAKPRHTINPTNQSQQRSRGVSI